MLGISYSRDLIDTEFSDPHTASCAGERLAVGQGRRVCNDASFIRVGEDGAIGGVDQGT